VDTMVMDTLLAIVTGTTTMAMVAGMAMDSHTVVLTTMVSLHPLHIMVIIMVAGLLVDATTLHMVHISAVNLN
jgi:hypothetical protein